MNKIKERNTFSIEVNPDESSPALRDHANPSILDSSDMERQQGELLLQRPSVTRGGYCTKKCFFLTFFHRTTFFVSDFIITTCWACPMRRKWPSPTLPASSSRWWTYWSTSRDSRTSFEWTTLPMLWFILTGQRRGGDLTNWPRQGRLPRRWWIRSRMGTRWFLWDYCFANLLQQVASEQRHDLDVQGEEEVITQLGIWLCKSFATGIEVCCGEAWTGAFCLPARLHQDPAQEEWVGCCWKEEKAVNWRGRRVQEIAKEAGQFKTWHGGLRRSPPL